MKKKEKMYAIIFDKHKKFKEIRILSESSDPFVVNSQSIGDSIYIYTQKEFAKLIESEMRHITSPSEIVDDSNDLIFFEIKIYEQEILRVRETYPGYEFCEEFENDGINLEVFKKNEDNGKQRYVIYFYYGNEKYAVIGMVGNEKLKEIAIEYQKAVVDNYWKQW